ncbi:MAG: leucine-rich repeat domain-containing protein [Clostridia bacterium]|nr:leucine-rich repeat domain-containing protein [Clostridia bacterium]
MKLIRLLTLCLSLLCIIPLVACGRGDSPSAPEDVRVEYETLTLRWSEVKGARIYNVRIEGEGIDTVTKETSRSYYSLEYLPAGKYSLSVRTVGKDSSRSSFSETVEFIRDEECGLVLELTDGGYCVTDRGDATGVVEIPATYRQRPVVSIGDEAFFNAADITEVIIPDGVRSIGAFAFSSCSYLEKVNIPDSVVSIGESAFSGCRMLKGTLRLPSGLTEISKGAFAYCSGIREIEFGEGIVYIGENAFTDLSDLERIVLPSSLEKIGGFAFAACADVTEIVFPEGLTEIGEFAFSKALSLTSVELPDSLLKIGKGAFYHSSLLSEVRLGESVCEIGDSAFLETALYNGAQDNEIYVGDWFIGLKSTDAISLSIREGTVGIANSALYANQYITAVVLPDTVRYIGSNAFAVSNLVSIVTGSGITEIGAQAFLYCERLIDVALGSYDYVNQCIRESSLLSIGDYAFMNCTKLARIQIPDTVRDIGAYAFRGTDMYNSATTGAVYAGNWIVDFNKTVTADIAVDKGTVGIARYAFYNCTELKSIKIDNSVKVICKGAFYNCTALESVTLPDTLAKIEDYVFYSCSSLRITSLPPMLKEIGRSAFYMCGTSDNYVGDTDSDRLEIPVGVTKIGDYAFFGCGYRTADAIGGNTQTVGIDTVIMGDKLEYVGKSAFRGFASLKSVVIAGACEIGESAFYGCESLNSITVASSLVKIGERAFYKCGELAFAEFPDTLTEVGAYAFYGCESLVSVRLGRGVTEIGNGAFMSCLVLSDLRLPSTLISIGEQAFRSCGSLTYLALGAGIENIGAHAFYACDSLTLYVDASLDVSDFSEGWNSTFVPAVLGCEISAEGFVLSVLGGESTVLNGFSDVTLSAPKMEGCVFLGWSSYEDAAEAEYPTSKLLELAAGQRLYSVFHPEQVT